MADWEEKAAKRIRTIVRSAIKHGADPHVIEVLLDREAQRLRENHQPYPDYEDLPDAADIEFEIPEDDE